MKKRLRFILLFILMTFSLSSCFFGEEGSLKTYKVSLIYNDEANNTIIMKTDYEQRLSKPATPIKEGYIFKAWVDDSGNEYDFSKKVNKNFNLYATYYLDFAYYGNYLTENTIKETIMVKTNIFKSSFNQTVTSTLTGSGVIIDRKNDTYYCLTNNHVVYTQSPHAYQVTDYLENVWDATLLFKDANYDLALLKFTVYSNKDLELPVAKIRDEQVIDGENIAAIGNPLGQRNSITYGTSEGFGKITIGANDNLALSNVQFECIKHSAFINNGSSGGGLFDEHYNLIGINFAAAEAKDTNKFMHAYAIPINKVKEFLKNNNYEL